MIWSSLIFNALERLSGATKPAPIAMVQVRSREEFLHPPTMTRKRRAEPRDVTEVDTLCIHQTACEFGTTQRQRDKWGGVTSALLARFCRTPYHVVAMRRGIVFRNLALDVYSYHGHRSNRRSMGVAVEGHFPEYEHQRKPKHSDLMDVHVEAGRQAMREACAMVAAAGGRVRYVTAHRCWANKPADPGELVWRRIVAPMMEELGLELLLHVDREWKGTPVPVEWWPELRPREPVT